mgnify:CR=1 FL=1
MCSSDLDVLDDVSALAFPTEEIKEIFAQSYPRTLPKSHILKHSFLPQINSKKKITRNDSRKIIFRYLGEFYGPRTPTPLIQGLSILREKNPKLLENISFEFYTSDFTRRQFSTLITEQVAHLVTWHPRVSYLKSLKLMESADCLLNFDAFFSSKNIFLSAKIGDYIGSGTPILSFSQEGTSSNLVSKYGGIVCSQSNPVEYASKLEITIRKIGENHWREELNKSETDCDTVAGNLLDFCKTL